MIDIDALFARQAAWQQSRARLPWSEKLRQALVLREAQLALRDTSRLPRQGREPPVRPDPGSAG